jgi:hypothetical protein
MVQVRQFASKVAGLFCCPNHNENLRSRETSSNTAAVASISRKRTEPIPSKVGMARDKHNTK